MTSIARPVWHGSWLRHALLGLLGLALGGTIAASVGTPSDLQLVLIFGAAVFAAELFLLDFPDRRGVSTAALPVTLAVAAGGPAVAVWAAGLGSVVAAALLRRPFDQLPLAFGRAGLAAALASSVAAVGPGALGSADPAAGLLAAVAAIGIFSATSELVTLGQRWIGGRDLSHVDLAVSLALVPLAVAAWAVQARAGATGLAAVGGGLVALLAVVRSAINVSTHHADLRRAYDLVERERSKLSTLLASSGEGIFVVGPDGVIVQLNDELRRLSGRSVEALGRRIETGLPFALASDELLEVALQRVRPGQPLQSEAVLTTPGGEKRDVLLSYAVVPSPDGAYGGIGIVRDISAMKAAQRERDDFVAVMTHDLRQPLTGLLGYAQLIEQGAKRGGQDPDRLLRYTQGIRRGGEQMLRMITNLLELARLEGGELALDVVDVRPRQLVDEVVQALDAQIAEKRLTVELDLPADLPHVRTSETLLRECLANLVGNAVKYTPKGGRVTVAARPVGANLRLTVADTGIGIPADELPRMFQRFFRSSQAEVRTLRGSGLGLALTRTMIERLGGTIAVESTLGGGTTFTVSLPFAVDDRRSA